MLTEAWEATVCGLAVGQAQGLHSTWKDRYQEAARSTGRDPWQQMATATWSLSKALRTLFQGSLGMPASSSSPTRRTTAEQHEAAG
jgi:hypothetical protein